MADRKLIVEFVGDDRDLQRTITKSTQALDKFGKQTSGTTPTGRVPIRSTGADEFLEETRELRRRADEVVEQERRIQQQTDRTRESLRKAAVVGAGAFAFGRTLSGAGAGLEALAGGATDSSRALNDAGEAIESLITLNPAGFFKAVGDQTKRTKDNLVNYAKSLTDLNNQTQAVQAASALRALGFEKEAEQVERNVQALKNMKAAQDALDFSARKDNVVVGADGRTRLVRFRGAGAAEEVRGGLGGASGVRIQRDSVEVKVDLDGEPVAKNTTARQQKNKRRNPRAKSGPNSGYR